MGASRESEPYTCIQQSFSCQARKPKWISIYASRGKKNSETVESVSLMRNSLEHKSCAVIGAWKSVRFNIFVKFIWSFWPLHPVMYPELLHSFKPFVSLEFNSWFRQQCNWFFFFFLGPLMMWNTACMWIICCQWQGCGEWWCPSFSAS